MSRHGRLLLFSAAAMTFAMCASRAWTQEASSNSSSENGMLEEIVVTAQKREENIQEAPAAITALTGDSLRQLGVTDAISLENVVPGLAVRPEGSVSQLFMRGVGNTYDPPNLEAGVALNINGVYLPR